MASLEAQVAHIWRRLGFGPTRKDINAGKGMGTAALVDSLFRRPRVDFAAAGFPSASAGEDAHAGRQLELMAFGPTATGSGTRGRPPVASSSRASAASPGKWSTKASSVSSVARRTSPIHSAGTP